MIFTVEIFHVQSLKRDNGRVIGVAALQARAKSPYRFYFSAETIYHRQKRSDPDKLIVTAQNPTTSKQISFRIFAEKNEDYYVKEPSNENELSIFRSLPEYSYHPDDFL